MALVLELGNGQRLENFEEHDRKSLDCLEQAVGRNMDVKDAAGDDLEGNEAHIARSWRKGDPD